MLGKPTLKPTVDGHTPRGDYGVPWNSPTHLVRRPNWGGREPKSRAIYLGFRLARDSNHEGERDEKED
jgi:hypothetical protein